jgi:hypothetical protein
VRTFQALLLGCVLAAAPACSDAPSKADCEKLLDHLIELQARAGGGSGEMSAEAKDALDKQKKQVIEFAAGQKFIETCTQKTPKKVVECGLGAKDLDAVAACDDGK